MIQKLIFIGILALLFVAGTGPDSSRSKVTEIPERAESSDGEEAEKASLGQRTWVIPTPVWVIGSYDREGKPNVMTSSWVGISCSKPASLMTCLREATYTHGNIMERKAFTVNIASESLASQVVYVGRVSGRDVDKFKETRLTPVKSSLVDAPYVKEFPLIIECRLRQTVELGLHTMFIGEIMDIKADRSILSEEGVPNIEKLKPFVFTPGSSKFYGIGELIGEVSDLAKEAEKK
ncbi:MAG TPA: flavin reductase family protein [Acidobacteriota bacterium]|nr:flavin reductase family protein [Acidobacteriota bacterium]